MRNLKLVLVTVVALSTGLSPATPAVAANVQFQVGTLNILFELNHADFVHDLELITSKVDMVGLNEVGARKEFLKDWAAAHDWSFYAPDPVQSANEALLAKKSMFEVLDKGSNFVCDSNGPDENPPAKYNNWVKYRHKASGRPIFHINFHANSSIESGGRPEDLPRVDCAEKQFQAIKTMAINKNDEGQVIVSGDLNVDFSADRAFGYAKFPWKVFEANDLPNLRSCYNLFGEKGTGTLGARHIDYIYFWKRFEENRHMWMRDYSIVTGTNSDHNGVVANFAIEL